MVKVVFTNPATDKRKVVTLLTNDITIAINAVVEAFTFDAKSPDIISVTRIA